MNQAYCGVDCATCEVFRATISGDHEQQTCCARDWTPVAVEHWGMTELKAEDMVCRGCRDDTEPLFLASRFCPIRSCCRERGYTICAECSEWRECKRLAGLLADVPAAYAALTRYASLA